MGRRGVSHYKGKRSGDIDVLVMFTNVCRSEYLDMERQWYDRSPYVNQALFNPEWIYGASILRLAVSVWLISVR